MKTLLAVIVSLVSFGAQADIIKCTFTEPFVSFDYSMTQSSMTVKIYAEDPPQVKKVKNVSLQIMGPGLFELRDKNNVVLAKLNLNNQGSDGMSDRIYPYSVEWNGLYGGCTSNYLAASQGEF